MEKELDRIDNDGNYEKGNLRWVTSSENKGNTRRSVRIIYKGQEMYFARFVRECTNLSYSYARNLYKNGVELEDIASRGKPKGL